MKTLLKNLNVAIATTLLLLTSLAAKAQVNGQLYYDFGDDRKFATLTLEMFKADKWGNTYFFVDHDFNYNQHVDGNNIAQGGTYTEIARCLNFWQQTKLSPLSLQLEYDGGITKSYPINNAFLAGANYFIHSQDFRNTLTIQILYKRIKDTDSNAPLQFTIVWAMNDLFGLKGLKFDGFADFWWEDHTTFNDNGDASQASTVFISEPQLWYNIGRHLNIDNLNIGTEIELSANFGSTNGFKCRPCLGVKWDF